MLTYFWLAVMILGQAEPPNVPVSQPNPDYPVHIRILENKWNRSLGTYTGFGRADLLDADHRGLDFTFECNQPFLSNRLRGEFYQAKWKKQDQNLELLVQRVGSSHVTHCLLKTTMKQAAYSKASADWTTPGPAPAAAPAPASPVPAATPPPIR